MNNLGAGNNIEVHVIVDSSDESSVGSSATVDQASRLTTQPANSFVDEIMDLDPIGESYDIQSQHFIGKLVSKDIGGVMRNGIVEVYSNSSEMFKVVYTNGYSEEMRLESLVKHLLPERPSETLPAELRRNESPHTKQAPGGSAVVPGPGADDASKQADSRLRRSSRKGKQVPPGGYAEVLSDDGGCGDEDYPDYGPTPPLIKLPWYEVLDDSPPRQRGKGRRKGHSENQVKGRPREIRSSATKDQSKRQKDGSAEKVGCCMMRATYYPPFRKGHSENQVKGRPGKIRSSATKDQSKSKKDGSAEKVGCCMMRATYCPPFRKGHSENQVKGRPRKIRSSATKDQSKSKKDGSAEKVGCCMMRATHCPPFFRR